MDSKTPFSLTAATTSFLTLNSYHFTDHLDDETWLVRKKDFLYIFQSIVVHVLVVSCECDDDDDDNSILIDSYWFITLNCSYLS